MSAKTERPQVRTAQDLERKYAQLFSGTAIKQTAEGLTKVNMTLNEFIAATVGDLDTLQAQLDGQIETWYGSYTPTLANKPAVDWQVSDYPNHVGDLFYDNSTGKTYQFNDSYLWEEIESSLMSEILSMANASQDTADSKRRVFVVQPSPPYDRGDLWLDNQDLYVCQIARQTGSYTSGDFIIATKYTDDTVALTAQEAAEIAQQEALDVRTNGTNLDLNFLKRITLNDDTVLDEQYSHIEFLDGGIDIYTSGSTIKMHIDNDSIEFQTSNGDILASWSATSEKATSTELKLGNFAFIPRENGSLGFRKVV